MVEYGLTRDDWANLTSLSETFSSVHRRRSWTRRTRKKWRKRRKRRR